MLVLYPYCDIVIVPVKLIPIFNLGFGILVAFLSGIGSGDWKRTLLIGLSIGLSATGLFSGVKNVVEHYTPVK